LGFWDNIERKDLLDSHTGRVHRPDEDSQKSRVLMLIERVPYEGGSRLRYFIIARELSKLGCETHLITMKMLPSDPRVLVEGNLRVYYLPVFLAFRLRGTAQLRLLIWTMEALLFSILLLLGRRNTKLYLNFSWSLAVGHILKKLFKLETFVIFHETLWRDLSAIPRSLRDFHRLCLEYVEEDRFVQRVTTLLTNFFLLQILRRDGFKIFCVSRATKNMLLPWVMRPDVFVVWNGVDLDFVDSVPDREREDVVVYIGRLSRSKRIEDLIMAFKQVKRRFENARLTILGSGPRESDVRTLISKCCLEHAATRRRWASEFEKFKMLKGCRLLVLPSVHEGFGLVVAEAFACRTPVVAYDLPALRDAFDDIPVYVKEGDVQGLAKAIVGLLEDPDLCADRGIRGRRLVESAYTWKKVALEECRHMFPDKG